MNFERVGRTLCVVALVVTFIFIAIRFTSDAQGQNIPQLQKGPDIPVSRICYARVRCADVDPGNSMEECMDNLGIVYTRCMSTCEECFMDDDGYRLCAMGCFLDANGDIATFPPLDGCINTVCDAIYQ